MKYVILVMAVMWGVILTAEPALASCSQSSYIVEGKFVLCTTCCYPGSGCQTTCN